MKLALALLFASSLAFADPSDAPTKAELVPMTEPEAVACLTCAKDLKDCNADNAKWTAIAAGAGVVIGVVIGLAAGFAMGKKL
jgi:ABC-type nitrate/sulfonate/bicarbonate transport system permease component